MILRKCVGPSPLLLSQPANSALFGPPIKKIMNIFKESSRSGLRHDSLNPNLNSNSRRSNRAWLELTRDRVFHKNMFISIFKLEPVLIHARFGVIIRCFRDIKKKKTLYSERISSDKFILS